MNGILRGRRTLAMEMIALQEGAFASNLDALHEAMLIKVQDGTYSTGAQINDSEEVAQINKLVWDRMKLKIFVTWEKEDASVIPFYINGKSIFNRFSEPPSVVDVGQAQQIRKFTNGQVGTIDEKNAKVSGIFSEYECYIFMDYLHEFSKSGLNMTAREVSATLIHEIGHIFYILAYSNRVASTNLVLSSILEEIKTKGKKADRQYIYRELKDIDVKIDQSEVDEFVDGTSVVAGYRWYLRVLDSLGETPSALINNKYDESSFEALSDNFTSRFGYGRELVSVLDKINVKDGAAEKFLLPAIGVAFTDILFLNQVLGAIIGAAYGVVVTTSFSTGIIAVLAIFGAYAQLLKLYRKGEDFKDYTYDDLRDRYKRIRQDMVAQLKDLKVPAAVKSSIIGNINSIDQMMDETRKVMRPANIVSNWVFASNRSTKKSVVEQQLMEELANNDLFLKSAQLSTV